MLEFPLVRITCGVLNHNVAPTPFIQPCFHRRGYESKELVGSIIIHSTDSLADTNITVASGKQTN